MAESVTVETVPVHTWLWFVNDRGHVEYGIKERFACQKHGDCCCLVGHDHVWTSHVPANTMVVPDYSESFLAHDVTREQAETLLLLPQDSTCSCHGR